ncbi:MAG: MFS transporter [Pseudomonadota bacterium]
MAEGTAFTRDERRAASGLAAVFACRMLGLFMVLPVLSVYADDLAGATPLLIGLAIGIYGLMQGALQIPFGMVSDRVGRKPVITAGLLIFVLGSVVAANSDHVLTLILGRALQGAGAVAAAVMALAADLSRERQRTIMMAILGGTIGLAFMLSLVLGPALAAVGGLGAVFWAATALGLAAIAVLHTWVPTPPGVPATGRPAAQPAAGLSRVIAHPELWRLDAGVFVLHAMMTALFVAAPLALRDAGIGGGDQWQVYVPAVLGSLLVLLPLVYLAERRARLRAVFLLSITLLAITPFGVTLADATWHFGVLLAVFFGAFSALEAVMPSRVSKIVTPDLKGTALGVYASCQFFGAFAGGVLGGLLFGAGGAVWLFSGSAALALLWLGIASGMSGSAKPRADVAAAQGN